MQCEDRGRDWNDAALKPRSAQDGPQPSEARRKTVKQFPVRLPVRTTGWHFDFDILASRTARGYISVVQNHPVCGSFVQQL